jgi:hypothetical protein
MNSLNLYYYCPNKYLLFILTLVSRFFSIKMLCRPVSLLLLLFTIISFHLNMSLSSSIIGTLYSSCTTDPSLSSMPSEGRIIDESSAVTSLLNYKAHSTVPCFDSDSTCSTVKWKHSGMMDQVQEDKPGEFENLPVNLSSPGMRSALMTFPVVKIIADFLSISDLCKLTATCQNLRKHFNDYGKAVLRAQFPRLDGISADIVFIRLLMQALNHKHFTHVSECIENCFDVRESPLANLMAFIHHKNSSTLSSNERFALVNLIEFLRVSNLLHYSSYEDLLGLSSFKLPSPLSVFFPNNIPHDMELFKKKIVSIVMMCANCGNVRVLRKLVEDLNGLLSPVDFGAFILENVLLCSEADRSVSGGNSLPWSPLHRSVHAPNTDMSIYLLNILTGLDSVLAAYAESLETPESNVFERIFFPLLSKLKLKKHLQRRMLNYRPGAVAPSKPIHMAILKSSCHYIFKLFLGWESRYNGPITVESLKLFVPLALASKSLFKLRSILGLVTSQEAAQLPLFFEHAMKYDWPEGLDEYIKVLKLNLSTVKLGDFNNILHLAARFGAVKTIEYLHEKYFDDSTFDWWAQALNKSKKRPLSLAIENGHWSAAIMLQRLGSSVSFNDCHFVLKSNSILLDTLFIHNDSSSKEFFALRPHLDNHSISNFEWAIISKNLEALQWFMSFLSVEALSRFDGAGQTPLHIAVIVGNCEAVKLLVSRFPTLANKQNIQNENPLELALKLQSRASENEIIKNIIDILKN